MELRCGPCGRAALYPIGRLTLDPAAVDPAHPETVDEAFGFTGYFRCKHCGAGGPWHLTSSSRQLLATLLREASADPYNARLIPAKTVLFDGTPSRWPTQGEEHLKALIANNPDDDFLWTRLGNLYKTADVYELAIEAYDEAIRREAHQIEAMNSLAELHHTCGRLEECARWLHRVLQHARHAPASVPAVGVRAMVWNALAVLSRLHVESGRRISLFPEVTDESQAALMRQIDANLLREDFDPSRKAEEIERLIDLWVGERAPRPKTPTRPMTPARPTLPGRRATGARRQVGRNDPCPCGSGKKYKACCGRS